MFLNARRRFNVKPTDINLLSSSVIVSLKHVSLCKGTWLTLISELFTAHMNLKDAHFYCWKLLTSEVTRKLKWQNLYVV